MSEKTCKDCLHCTVDNDEVLCVDMPWHYPFGGEDRTELDKEACEYFLERPKKTIFDQITQSHETLAEKLVYEELITEESDGYVYRWRSTILPNDFWYSAEKAVAATVAKLKEVTK